MCAGALWRSLGPRVYVRHLRITLPPRCRRCRPGCWAPRYRAASVRDDRRRVDDGNDGAHVLARVAATHSQGPPTWPAPPRVTASTWCRQLRHLRQRLPVSLPCHLAAALPSIWLWWRAACEGRGGAGAVEGGRGLLLCPGLLTLLAETWPSCRYRSTASPSRPPSLSKSPCRSAPHLPACQVEDAGTGRDCIVLLV